MNRTISSARAFLSGLFHFNGQIRANGSVISTSISTLNKIFSFHFISGPFQIEVHHFPDENMVKSNEKMRNLS